MITVTITATTLLIITFIEILIICGIAWWINTRKTPEQELLDFTSIKGKYNKKPKVIHGHYDLELVVGNLYEIHYGVHQGIYEYLGQETEGFWEGAFRFKNIETNNEFCYYGTNSPYEFTSIVEPYNK